MTGKSVVSHKVKPSKDTITEVAKKLAIEQAKDRELVKGVFKYYEVPGGVMEFCFKKYKGDPLEKYELHDNKVYTIPLGVAKHINNNTWYPIHQYTKNEDGSPAQTIGQKIRRMAFQSLEFMDVDGMGDDISKVITVNNVLHR